MKKLMIALSAATAVALGAKAEETTLLGGMDFESYAEGAYITTDSAGLWSTTKKLEEGETNVGGESQVKLVESNKYLAVDTTDTLMRNTAPAGAEQAAPVAIPADGGYITISTKVQFTAADEAPTVADGDKLLVWMRAAVEATGETEALPAAVMVTDKEGVKVLKSIEKPDEFTAAWHTLAIKAVATGSGLAKTSSFTVTLDGVEYGTDTPFASLVTGGDAAQTISSIGFKGTGAVDDIGFVATDGETIPTAAISGSISGYDAEAEYEVLFQDEKGEDVTTAKVGDTFTVIVTGALATDTVSCDDLNFEWDGEEFWTAEYTVTTADGTAGAKAFTVTVTAGEGPTPVKPTVNELPTNASWVDGKAPAATYAVGSTIDPTAFQATTTTPHKKAVVTVTVNDTQITGEYTVKAGDEIVITVTEEDIMVAVTVTAATGTEVDGVEAGEVVEGSTLTFTVSVADGYKADTLVVKNGETTLEAVKGTYTVVADADVAITTTVDALATVNVTVDAATVGATVSVASTATEGSTLTFTVSVDTDYDVEKLVVTVDGTTVEAEAVEDSTLTFTVTVGTDDIVIKAVAPKKQSGGDWPADWKVPATATADQFAAYQTWVAAGNDPAATNAKEAFLMGVNLDEKFEPLAATSIAIVEGKVVITTNAGPTPNGVIYVKYGDTVECDDGVVAGTDALPADTAAKFYKVCIDFAMPKKTAK